MGDSVLNLNKKKILLIGWDGADWEHINPLVDGGLMPTFNDFINEGTIGNLATLRPVLSPMLWNSVATGKFADKHGIHGFVEPNPGMQGARPFSSTSRKTKAIWNIFSQNGIRSNVINWWASHPAEPIDGVVVSNLFHGVKLDPVKGWQISPGTIHPPELAQQYAQFRFFAEETGQEHILPFIPDASKIDQSKDKRLTTFAKVFSEMVTTHSIATATMELQPWDFMAIYYTGIDHFSHAFMQYHPPQMDGVSDDDFELYKGVIKSAYRFHDMMLERLLTLAGEDTTVIICSDHGFQSGNMRPAYTPREPAGPAVWHRQYGIVAMKGEGIKKDERITGASLIDIGPTVLHLAGLPVGEDMDGKVLIEAFEDPQPIETVPSWDAINDGHHGMITSEDPESESANSDELLKQFVALGYIDDIGTDKKKQARSAEIECKYNLARCLVWQGRTDEAQPIFEDILAASPWEDRFILEMADCYLRQGYLTQVCQLIKTAYELPAIPYTKGLITYGKACLRLGNSLEGQQYLNVAAQRERLHPSMYVELGKVFARQRNFEKAEGAFKKSIGLVPEYAHAHQGLAKIYIRQKRYQEAADAALRSLGLLFRLPESHLCLGIAMARSQQTDRAILAMETALKFAPRMVMPLRYLIRLHEANGNSRLADGYRKRLIDAAQFSVQERTRDANRRGTLFPHPELLSYEERIARLMKERPQPSDPVEKSGKCFVLVSGLPRSGTSLMMQMLIAGGAKVIADSQRVADENNPKGYFELESIKSIGEQPELLDTGGYENGTIKVVSMLLSKLPPEHDYKIIFMMRPIEEVAVSQEKMISQLGTDGANMEASDLRRSLHVHRQRALKLIDDAKNMESLTVSYPTLVTQPSDWIGKISDFLGKELLPVPEKMVDAIDHSLHRNRVSSLT